MTRYNRPSRCFYRYVRNIGLINQSAQQRVTSGRQVRALPVSSWQQQQQQQQGAVIALSSVSRRHHDQLVRQCDGLRAAMPLFSTASSRSTAVAATFWLVVLLGNNLSASLLIARRGRVQDLYSPNGNFTFCVFIRDNYLLFRYAQWPAQLSVQS